MNFDEISLNVTKTKGNLLLEIGSGKKCILNTTYRDHTGGASGLASVEAHTERLRCQIILWKRLQEINDDLIVICDINLE